MTTRVITYYAADNAAWLGSITSRRVNTCLSRYAAMVARDAETMRGRFDMHQWAALQAETAKGLPDEVQAIPAALRNAASRAGFSLDGLTFGQYMAVAEMLDRFRRE